MSQKLGYGSLDPEHLLTMRVLVAFCVISFHISAATVPNRIAIIGGIEAKPNALPWNVINFHKGETRCSSTIIQSYSNKLPFSIKRKTHFPSPKKQHCSAAAVRDIRDFFPLSLKIEEFCSHSPNLQYCYPSAAAV